MELGVILILLATVLFGLMGVIIRRAVYQSEESSPAAAISVFVGTPLFILVLPFTVDWNLFYSLPWQVFVVLGIAGIMHFVLGRHLLFNAIRFIGANKTMAISRTNSIFVVIFGTAFLGESLTALLVLGVLSIVVGAILVGYERGKEAFRLQARGVLLSLGGALSVATSALLIKSVIAEVGSPYAAAFISYSAAFLLWSILLLQKEQRDQILRLSRSSLVLLVVAGVLGLAGQLLRYAAFQLSPVSVVQPLVSTVVLFTLFFSFLINRKIDVFNRKVISGIILVVAGVLLLSL